MRCSSVVTGLLASTILASSGTAQEALDLGELVLSGGLSPIQTQALARSNDVLTAQDIADKGVTSVQDALRALPGVSVNGTSNSSTQVRIRGGESNHTLILIDGIEAAGGDGEYTLSGLETANIAQIEVLRGPQSVAFGSNASAGVINIITDTGKLGTTLRGAVEAGSDGSTIASAFTSYRDDRGGVALGVSRTDDKGYDQSGDGGEKDALERNTLTFSADYKLTDQLKAGLTLRRSEERYEFDSNSFTAFDADSYVVDDPTQFATRNELTAGVFAEYEMLDGRMTHRLSFARTANDLAVGLAAPTETTSKALKYRLSFALDGARVENSDQLVNVMLESTQDASSSNPLYARKANSIAAEYRGAFGNGWDVQAGLRFDDNDVFQDATTWNAGLSYTLPGNGIRIHASAGAGSVNPSYFELYANAFGYTGNPGLRAERNKSFDIGVEVPILSGRGSVDVTYFNERLTDEITAVSTGPGTFNHINQTGESTRQGVEVASTLQATDALSLRLAYTYLDAKNPDGTVEIRRPKHEFNLGAALDTFGGRGTVSANLRHVSGNADTQFWGAYNTVELPAYTTLDLGASYDLTDTLTLTGRVQNAFDIATTDVWGYANRGRAVYVGIRADF